MAYSIGAAALPKDAVVFAVGNLRSLKKCAYQYLDSFRHCTHASHTGIHTVDGGNLAPLLQRKFFTAPYPLLNIGIDNLQKQICSNDGNLAPPQTEQLSILTRGCGDASSSHRRCLLCRWCKISSIHSIINLQGKVP